MAEITKETVVAKSGSDQVVSSTIKNNATRSETIEKLIYFIFGFIEVLLAMRLILKLTGASMSSGFVKVIYSITGIFTIAFDGIFSKGTVPGVSTIFEPGTLVAIAVYALIAWGIVKLLQAISGEAR